MHDINCYVTVCSSKLISILLLPIISFAALGYRLIYLCSTSVPLFERVLLILGDKIKVGFAIAETSGRKLIRKLRATYKLQSSTGVCVSRYLEEGNENVRAGLTLTYR